jgi:hypothetical protein
MGKRILSTCMVLSLKSNTTPSSCMVLLLMMRSYIGVPKPGLYSTMSGVRCTFLLQEKSTKATLMSPTLSVTKVPLEVLHDSGVALLITGMLLEAPFKIKRRSPLKPKSSRTLIDLFLTISLLLLSFSCFLAQIRLELANFSFFLAQSGANFFDFSDFSYFRAFD